MSLNISWPNWLGAQSSPAYSLSPVCCLEDTKLNETHLDFLISGIYLQTFVTFLLFLVFCLSVLTSEYNWGGVSWLEEALLSTSVRPWATVFILRGGIQTSIAGALKLSFIILNPPRYHMPHTHGLSEMLTKFLYLYLIFKRRKQPTQ